MPRDVDPGVGEVPDVTLLDLDDLKDFGEQRSAERRRARSARCARSSRAEIERYRVERAAREVAPLVTVAARPAATTCAPRELERFRAKLDAARPRRARRSSRRSPQGIVNKLLHEPTVRVKDAAGTAARRLLRRRARDAVRPPDDADADD